jgi:hypothetical protein
VLPIEISGGVTVLTLLQPGNHDPGTSRKKQETISCSGTIEQNEQEVKIMNMMNREEGRRYVPLTACGRARIFYLLRKRMVTWPVTD